MLLTTVARRWGLIVLGAALLGAGAIVLEQLPQPGEPRRYATYLPADGVSGAPLDPALRINIGAGLALAGILLLGAWTLVVIRASRARRHASGERTPL
jgi:hypothetical protein